MDELNIVTLKEIYPKVIVDQFFKASPQLAYFRDHCMVPFGGGSFMQNTWLYAPMIGGAYAQGATWNITKRETLGATFFDPKYYEVSVPEYKEQIQVQNKGPLAVFSLVDTDLRNGMNTISAITAIACNQHGQAAGATVAGNRVLEMNGFPEAINDGLNPSYDGNVYPVYGGRTRNGIIGGAINSTPLWGGNPDGSLGMIQYPFMEMMYQTASIGNLEPDLIVGNKAIYAYMKERLEVKQRLQQERDPIWGAMGFRFNSAMVLKDDYFPSLKFGVNDPNIGNYLTGSFVVPASATAASGLPTPGTTVTVGEVLVMYNTQNILFRLSDDPEYGYGWTGFKPAQDNSRVVGQILAAQNLEFPSVRLHAQAYGFGA